MTALQRYYPFGLQQSNSELNFYGGTVFFKLSLMEPWRSLKLLEINSFIEEITI